jgi:hypothetical protein
MVKIDLELDKVKTETLKRVLLELILFLFVLVLFSYPPMTNANTTSSLNNEAIIVENCSNLSLRETSSCLLVNIQPIFKYNITDDNAVLTFDELKTNGGDCKDWSQLYARLGKAEGFYTYLPRFKANETTDHQIAIISDNTGYCVLDQEAGNCIDFKS